MATRGGSERQFPAIHVKWRAIDHPSPSTSPHPLVGDAPSGARPQGLPVIDGMQKKFLLFRRPRVTFFVNVTRSAHRWF